MVQLHQVVLNIIIIISVGPAEQIGAFGWGIALWGGDILGALTTTLIW